MAQVVECLPNKLEALNSNLSTKKKKKWVNLLMLDYCLCIKSLC
jgi:hypothetical protein